MFWILISLKRTSCSGWPLVLEKGSPSNPITTLYSLSKISLPPALYTIHSGLGEYAQVALRACSFQTTCTQPKWCFDVLPGGWQSPAICSFNWPILSLNNWICSLLLSSKLESGMSGRKIRKITTQTEEVKVQNWHTVSDPDLVSPSLKRILREKGKWHMSTSTRGRTSNKRWGSAVSNIDW